MTITLCHSCEVLLAGIWYVCVCVCVVFNPGKLTKNDLLIDILCCVLSVNPLQQQQEQQNKSYSTNNHHNVHYIALSLKLCWLFNAKLSIDKKPKS